MQTKYSDYKKLLENNRMEVETFVLEQIIAAINNICHDYQLNSIDYSDLSPHSQMTSRTNYTAKLGKIKQDQVSAFMTIFFNYQGGDLISINGSWTIRSRKAGGTILAKSEQAIQGKDILEYKLDTKISFHKRQQATPIIAEKEKQKRQAHYKRNSLERKYYNELSSLYEVGQYNILPAYLQRKKLALQITSAEAHMIKVGQPYKTIERNLGYKNLGHYKEEIIKGVSTRMRTTGLHMVFPFKRLKEDPSFAKLDFYQYIYEQEKYYSALPKGLSYFPLNQYVLDEKRLLIAQDILSAQYSKQNYAKDFHVANEIILVEGIGTGLAIKQAYQAQKQFPLILCVGDWVSYKIMDTLVEKYPHIKKYTFAVDNDTRFNLEKGVFENIGLQAGLHYLLKYQKSKLAIKIAIPFHQDKKVDFSDILIHYDENKVYQQMYLAADYQEHIISALLKYKIDTISLKQPALFSQVDQMIQALSHDIFPKEKELYQEKYEKLYI